MDNEFRYGLNTRMLLGFPQLRRCGHCGKMDEYPAKVHLVEGYVGGTGHVTSYQCVDTEACWQRWEADKRKSQGSEDDILGKVRNGA